MPFVEILFMINLHWICIIFAVVTKYSAHGSFQLQTELGTQGGGREGGGVLSYVICLLPSWALEYGRVIARYIHFHQNRHWTLLDLVCVWPSVFTRISRLGRNLCRWQLWVCFLECCSNTLERIKIAVRYSYRRNPHPVPCTTYTKPLPTRSTSDSGMEWSFPHILFTRLITVFAKANHRIQTWGFISSVTAGEFRNISLK